MKNLLYKEFKLIFNPIFILFILLVGMILIPNYPYLVAFIYIPISFIYIFNGARENNDMYFTCLLPVKKTDIPFARIIVMMIYELIAVIIAIPLLYVNNKLGFINTAGNQANWALLGEVLVMYGIVNIIFFPSHYKTGVKTGIPFLIGVTSGILAGEVLDIIFAFFPYFKDNINVNVTTNVPLQLLVFFICLTIYIVLSISSIALSKRRTLKIEL